MNQTELMDLLQRFKWYQRIRLSDELYTPGSVKSEKRLQRIQLPMDLRGKSVLDIGCNEGFFAFEAERRGAAYVLAIDSDEMARKKFHIVKHLLKSNVEFSFLSVTDLDECKVGRFDVTLFLSVFHHLKYPFLALDKVAAVTSEMAIMEFLVAGMDGAEEPLVFQRMTERGRRSLLPTRRFLLETLERSGFAKVDIVTSYWKKPLHGYAGRYFCERVIVKAYP